MTGFRAPSFVRIALVATVLAILVAACAGAAGPSPSPTPGPPVTPADALARVVAVEPRLAGIQPFDAGVIGQSSWYTVEPASGVGVFIVGIRIGWGDCQAGCIDEHLWSYAIGPQGEVTLLSEMGPPVPPEAWPGPTR